LTDYRRARIAGATGFFTLGLAERRRATILFDKSDALGVGASRRPDAAFLSNGWWSCCRIACIASIGRVRAFIGTRHEVFIRRIGVVETKSCLRARGEVVVAIDAVRASPHLRGLTHRD
jgi:hypothetical protein